VYECSRRY